MNELIKILANSEAEAAIALSKLEMAEEKLIVSRETEKQLKAQLEEMKISLNRYIKENAELKTIQIENAQLQGKLDGEREARARADIVIQQTLTRFDDLINAFTVEEAKEIPVPYKLDFKRNGNGQMYDIHLKPEV